MSAFLHSWKFHYFCMFSSLFISWLRTPGSFAFVWEEGSDFWWPQMYPRDSAPRLKFNLVFLHFLAFSGGGTINISFKYTIIKQAPCHAIVSKESLTLWGPNEIQILQTHIENVILHMTILLHKMQWSSKQMSYYTELKGRKKMIIFFILCKRLYVIGCFPGICRTSEATERRSREGQEQKWLMKMVLGFCKRIDENSGINYLQKE